MKYSFDREKTINDATRAAAKDREAAAAFPVLKNVLTQFDGKVFNCRLQNALNEAAGRNYAFSVKKTDGGRIWIDFHCDCKCYSSDNDKQVLNMDAEKALIDGKRINAAAMIEEAAKQRADLLKSAADLDTAIEKLDETVNQLNQVENVLKGIAASFPRYTLHRLNLKIDIPYQFT